MKPADVPTAASGPLASAPAHLPVPPEGSGQALAADDSACFSRDVSRADSHIGSLNLAPAHGVRGACSRCRTPQSLESGSKLHTVHTLRESLSPGLAA